MLSMSCVDISRQMVMSKLDSIPINCLDSLQSSEALEFLKRDLTEFSTVVQHDTTCSIVATANAVRSKLAVAYSHFSFFYYFFLVL